MASSNNVSQPTRAALTSTSEFAGDAVIGKRLRKSRLERGLSLKGVEKATDGEVGAAALSSYERGQHAITARRLHLLAALYDISIPDLIEPNGRGSPTTDAVRPRQQNVRLDLQALDLAESREVEMIGRLVGRIRDWRSPRVKDSIVVRHEDLVTTAALLGESVESLVDALRDAGVLRRPRGRPSNSS